MSTSTLAPVPAIRKSHRAAAKKTSSFYKDFSDMEEDLKDHSFARKSKINKKKHSKERAGTPMPEKVPDKAKGQAQRPAYPASLPPFHQQTIHGQPAHLNSVRLTTDQEMLYMARAFARGDEAGRQAIRSLGGVA
jgi:hypothetical protein